MLKKLFLTSCLAILPMFGSSYTWTGTTSASWNNSGNWSSLNPTSYPQLPGDIATMSGSTNPTISVSAPISLGELDLDLSTGYSISGSAITFVSSGSGNTALNVELGSNTISNNIVISEPLIVTQTTNLTLSGQISGSAAMTLQGAGTLALTTTDNSGYTGQITLDAGTLSIDANNRLGVSSNSLIISNGALLYTASSTNSRNFSLTGAASIQTNAGVTATLNGTLSGSGSLSVSGANSTTSIVVLAPSSSNTYTGGTTVAAGVLQIASDTLGDSSGSLNFGNGTLSLTSAISPSISRSGTVFGNGTISSTTASNTFSGNFDGSGQLTFTGGVGLMLTLSGTNTYSGGNVISTNTTLVGTTSSIPGAVTLGASSTVIFNQSFNGSNTGAFSSSDNTSFLKKQGPGSVSLTGSSSGFSGATQVQAGTLFIDSNFSSSSVTVSSEATLGGSGTVGATTVNSGGTISPGSSIPATLSVSGNLTVSSGANTVITIAPLTADKIAATGTANVSGPLMIDPIAGFYGFTANYTILTSTGLTDAWGPVTSLVAGFVPSISDSGNNVLLRVDIVTPFVFFPFSNSNTEAVGNNIDALSAAGELTPTLLNICNEFIGQSTTDINEALDQMHPAPYSAFTELQAEFNGQLVSIFHRLPYLPCACQNPNRLWIEGIGNSLNVKRHGMQLGFQANSGGIALGYDGNIGNSCVFGVGGAWAHHALSWQHHRGRGTVNSVYGSVYVDSQVGDFYFGSAFLAGMDFYNTSRHIHFFSTDEHAHADYSALDLVGQISTAYLFGAPQAFFYPYLNLDYLYLHTHSFKETGAGGLNLHVFKRTDGTLRTEMGLGLQVQDRNAAETVCISPLVSLGWVNMCPIERPRLESTFEGSTIPFKVTGWDQSWNLFNIHFALSIAYYCNSLLLDYNVEFAPDHRTSFFNQDGRIRFDLKW